MDAAQIAVRSFDYGHCYLMNQGGFMIATAHLAKSYGPTHVLSDISLAVPQGEIYALLGRNGAGKTTLLNILITLAQADAGSARVAGFDVATAALEVRQRIGVTFQEPFCERLLRGRDVLDLQGQLYQLPAAERRRRIAELGEILAIAGMLDRPVKTYSGGQARRLDLARSLMIRPQVLFLDEPTAGLDAASRAQLWQYIRQLRAHTGLTVFLTTHLIDEAEAMADRVGILDGGRIVAEGAPEELIASVGGEVVTVSGAGEHGGFVAALADCPWVRSADVGSAAGERRMRAHLPTHAAAQGATAAITIRLAQPAGQALKPIIELGERHGFLIGDIQLYRTQLADVFAAYTGREDDGYQP
ncbi:ATP-binding cassette domain-containing protein [Chloroflexia bacterium SDU3-3]|nr:ATP-binding cassette domain-containing protein [Chloroflexia bacterium SDU3-3]